MRTVSYPFWPIFFFTVVVVTAIIICSRLARDLNEFESDNTLLIGPLENFHPENRQPFKIVDGKVVAVH